MAAYFLILIPYGCTRVMFTQRFKIIWKQLVLKREKRSIYWREC